MPKGRSGTPSKAKRFTGIFMLALGSAGVLFAVWGLYTWISVTQMLYFLTPSYGGLAFIILLLVVSVCAVALGCVLIRRPKASRHPKDAD